MYILIYEIEKRIIKICPKNYYCDYKHDVLKKRMKVEKNWKGRKIVKNELVEKERLKSVLNKPI